MGWDGWMDRKIDGEVHESQPWKLSAMC